MHKAVVTHVIACVSTEFIVSVSFDGVVKFWKKQFEGIEFVKAISTSSRILDCSLSPDGSEIAMITSARHMLLFDVGNFSLFGDVKLDFAPACLAHLGQEIAISCTDDNLVRIVQREGELTRCYKAHLAPVLYMKYSSELNTIVSIDAGGLIELWSPDTLTIPKACLFSSKLQTDLFAIKKAKTKPVALAMGKSAFAVLCSEGRLFIYRLTTAKLWKELDESFDALVIAQSDPHLKILHLTDAEFARRAGINQDVSSHPDPRFLADSVAFDASGDVLILSTPVGIKFLDLVSNTLPKILGKMEKSERFLSLAVYQGKPQRRTATDAMEDQSEASKSDPTIIATEFEKERFYLFSNRLPSKTRDVFNEKTAQTTSRPGNTAAPNTMKPSAEVHKYKHAKIKTSVGDFEIMLFPQDAPLAVENFANLSKSGYYNKCSFHRVIRGFMIQTGDPTGTGSGGRSVWQKPFENEIRKHLKHDRPFTVSMANAGPDTNGSQFFITTVPCPWLDGKHTVFGRVTNGQEVVSLIEGVKVGFNDKPVKDILIREIEISEI